MIKKIRGRTPADGKRRRRALLLFEKEREIVNYKSGELGLEGGCEREGGMRVRLCTLGC